MTSDTHPRHEHEGIFRALFDKSPDAIVIADDEGRYVDANAAAAQLFDVPLDRLIGRKVVDFAHPVHEGDTQARWSRFRTSEGAELGEFHLQRPNGEMRIVEYHATAQFRPGLNLSILRDITDRKIQEAEQAELLERTTAISEAVELQRKRLYGVFQQAPMPIAILRGPDHVYELSNAANQRMLKDRFVLGRPLREAVPEAPSWFLDAVAQAYQTGERWTGKELLMTLSCEPHASPLYLNVVVEPLIDLSGQVEGVLCTGIDITQLVVARERAQASQAKYRSLSESNVVGVIVTDLDGGLYEANDVFLRAIGYSRTELEQGHLRWDKLTPPELAEADRAAVAGLRAHGAYAPYEKVFLCRDGTRFPVLIGWASLESQTDRAICFVVDLSEQKRIETALKEALRTRDEFLSIASHELKTPMTALVLRLENRLRHATRENPRPLSPEERRNTLLQDRRQITRLSRLIDDMLDVSRINTGKLNMEYAPVEIGTLISEVLESHTSLAAEAGCPLRFAPAEPVVAEVDRQRIEQVVANLVSNAIKYAAGTAITVTLRRNSHLVELQVRDQGRGIAAEDQQRIFHRFERAVEGREIAGLGLGLYIVRRIVELHGGAIRVDSELGRGATFTVALPLLRADATAGERAPGREAELPAPAPA